MAKAEKIFPGGKRQQDDMAGILAVKKLNNRQGC